MSEKEITEGAVDQTVQDLLKKVKEIQENSVPKEEFNKIVESNKLLIEDITNNRRAPIVDETKKVTKADIIKRCEERTSRLGTSSNSYDEVTILVENYRDMQEVGMDVGVVDEKIVSNLEYLLKESKGDKEMFKALMESRIKADR